MLEVDLSYFPYNVVKNLELFAVIVERHNPARVTM